MVNLFIDLEKLKFRKTRPKDFAEELKQKFIEVPALWNDVISPVEKVKELKEITKGDYSLIWDGHCAYCYCPIDRETEGEFYLSEDNFTWLCKSCFEEFKDKFDWKLINEEDSKT